MFSRHWLIADMDGTLTSTPTKAGGEYLSLKHSPCYGPLRTFIANGGSLCVVSTAGRRMWRQIFNEVSDVLFPPSPNNSCANSASAVSTVLGGAAKTRPGRLAICGFSGAAMFLSDSKTQSMKEILNYRRTALKYNREGLYGLVGEDRAANGRGGSPDNGTSEKHKATAVIDRFLQHEQNAHHHFTESTVIDVENQDTIMDISVACVRAFINNAGDELLRAHLEKRESGNEDTREGTNAGDCATDKEVTAPPPLVLRLSAKYHEPYTAMAVQRNEYLLRAAAAANSEMGSAAKSLNQQIAYLIDEIDADAKEQLLAAFYEEVLNKERLMTHGAFIAKTNDALIDLQYIPGTANPTVGVQVTVMGIPMALYEDYFTPAVASVLASCGVSAKKQPNSVAITKKGIDKALCVKWMRDSFKFTKTTDACRNEGKKADGDGHEEDSFLLFDALHDFDLNRALSFGDIPSSVDKPLTAFPPMQFISASTTPSTDPTDTLAPLVFVGREEFGTAAFLEAMLEDVMGGTKMSEEAQTNDGEETLFTPARVAAWAEAARAQLATTEKV